MEGASVAGHQPVEGALAEAKGQGAEPWLRVVLAQADPEGLEPEDRIIFSSSVTGSFGKSGMLYPFDCNS